MRAAEEGAAAGFNETQITSFIGNEAARRAYEKAGYRCIDERRHSDFETIAGTPGLNRFVRSLEGARQKCPRLLGDRRAQTLSDASISTPISGAELMSGDVLWL
jgi:hypothetical protein